MRSPRILSVEPNFNTRGRPYATYSHTIPRIAHTHKKKLGWFPYATSAVSLGTQNSLHHMLTSKYFFLYKTHLMSPPMAYEYQTLWLPCKDNITTTCGCKYIVTMIVKLNGLMPLAVSRINSLGHIGLWKRVSCVAEKTRLLPEPKYVNKNKMLAWNKKETKLGRLVGYDRQKIDRYHCQLNLVYEAFCVWSRNQKGHQHPKRVIGLFVRRGQGSKY